jgi:hypothetical protein
MKQCVQVIPLFRLKDTNEHEDAHDLSPIVNSAKYDPGVYPTCLKMTICVAPGRRTSLNSFEEL